MSIETSRGDAVDPAAFDHRQRAAMSAGRGLRFCAGLRAFAALRTSSISVLEAPADGRRRGLAGFLHRLAGALAAGVAAVRGC